MDENEKKKDHYTIEEWVDKYFTAIMGYVWVICWFLAIWIHKYSSEFFLTGTFCLVLGLLDTAGKKKNLTSGEENDG